MGDELLVTTNIMVMHAHAQVLVDVAIRRARRKN